MLAEGFLLDTACFAAAARSIELCSNHIREKAFDDLKMTGTSAHGESLEMQLELAMGMPFGKGPYLNDGAA